MISHHSFQITTSARPEFFDVTERAKEALKASGLVNGTVLVYSQHTTCSVFVQEESEDTTYYGMQFILQDTLNAFAKIADPVRHEGQYLHPGPIHIANAASLRNEKPEWGLNTDGHIISSILGRSETIPVVDKQLILGEFGRIYFADLDSVRDRTRIVRITITGE
jgi:thiamine phosphate synthase YjbQ (UPF0047 family)